MTDPKRLYQEPESALEAELLNAGRRAAPAGAKERALVAASAVGFAEGLTAAGAAAKGIPAASAIGKAGLLAALKWAGILTVTGTIAAVATVALKDYALAAAPEQAKPSASVAVVTNEVVARAPSPSAVVAAPPAPHAIAAFVAPSASGARTSGTTVPRAAPRTPGDSSPPDDSRGISTGAPAPPTELALLERAQGALNAGEVHYAVAILDSYAERFPAGDMRDEAVVLRIEALARAGDHAQASQLADAFLAHAPESPYAARIRSLVLAHANP
jgi:hypothetical protein